MLKPAKDMRATAPIKLDFPFDFDGERVSELTMRRPKVRDSLKASKVTGGDAERGLALISDLIERPVELLHEMDETDLEKLQEQYAAFTGRQDITTP